MARRGEYTELQRQITELQAAVRQAHDRIDKVGDQVTNFITSLRADLHNDVQAIRDGLDRNAEAIHQAQATAGADQTDAQRILTEIQGLRADAAQARVAALEEERRLHEQQQKAEAKPETMQPSRPERDGEHEELLDLAADVAGAELSCHRDTWAFLVERSIGGIEHFRLPAGVDEDDGMVTVDISGRTLIATIEALWETQATADSAGTRAMASRSYRRIRDALQNLEPAEEHDQSITRIVIDSRPPKTSTDGSTSGGDAATG